MSTDIQRAAPDTGFPATELISVLLDFHRKDTSGFSRDAQLLAQVIQRSQVAYAAIQDCIQALLLSTRLDWDRFDAYTGVIPPFEKILLELTFRESNRPRTHLPPNDSVVDAVMFIEVWLEDRRQIYECLSRLAGREFQSLSRPELNQEYETARVHDDGAVFQEIYHFITSGARVRDNDIIRGGKLVSDIRNIVATIPAKLKSNPPNRVSVEESCN